MVQVSLLFEKNFNNQIKLTDIINGDYSIIQSHILDNGQDRLWLTYVVVPEPKWSHPQEDSIYEICMEVLKGNEKKLLAPNRRVMLWSKEDTGLRSWYDFAADSFYRGS